MRRLLALVAPCFPRHGAFFCGLQLPPAAGGCATDSSPEESPENAIHRQLTVLLHKTSTTPLSIGPLRVWPVLPVGLILFVNFVGSKISSTENGVLWTRGNLTASGCMSPLWADHDATVCICPPLSFIYTPRAHAAARVNLHLIEICCLKSCGDKRRLSVSCADTQTRSGPVGPPCLATSKCKCPLSAGGYRACYLLQGIWLKCAPFHSLVFLFVLSLVIICKWEMLRW